MFRKRLVEPPHPVVVLRLEEIGIETGEDGVRPHGPDPRLSEENLAELAGADGRDFLAEPPGALPTAEEGSELVPVEEFPQPPGARQASVLPGDPAAAEARQQRFRAQRCDRGLPQRREERAIRKPLAAERQAVERGKVEQIVIPEPKDRLVQQCAHPGHQRRVPRVPGREVVPRQGGAERPLDPKGEPRAQGGREEGEEGSVGLGHRFHATAPQSKRHLHLTLRGRRAGDGPREHQPGLLRLPLAIRFTAERHAARQPIEPLFLAQVQTRGSTVHLPLDDLDLAQEQQGARSEAAHRLPDDGPVIGRPERKREHGLVGAAGGEPGRRRRENEILDREVLGARVHPGPLGERMDRLETDAEAADIGQPRVLGALPDPADAADVGLVERLAAMGEPQFTGEQVKEDRARSGPALAPRQRVLGVLQQFVDEMGAVTVAVREQLAAVLANLGAVTAGVLAADRLIVAGHQQSASVINRVVSSARPP